MVVFCTIWCVNEDQPNIGSGHITDSRVHPISAYEYFTIYTLFPVGDMDQPQIPVEAEWACFWLANNYEVILLKWAAVFIVYHCCTG